MTHVRGTGRADAVTAKFGFQGIGLVERELRATRPATSSICSSSCKSRRKSDIFMSATLQSSTHLSFNVASKCLVKQFAGFMFPGTLPTLRDCWWTSSWTNSTEISMCRIRLPAPKRLAVCNAVLASSIAVACLTLTGNLLPPTV